MVHKVKIWAQSYWAELISQRLADKGPKELGHTRAMFESNYAEILEEYKDRDEDYSLLESRALKAYWFPAGS